MWIVATRERPDKLARLLAAFERTGARTPLLAVVDETEPHLAAYQALGCDILIRPGESVGCIGKFRYAVEIHAGRDWYGFLPDDCEPLTAGWDLALVAACKPGRIAYCDDGLPKPKNAMPTICGDFIRSIGMIAPAGLEHYGCDRFWKMLARGTGRMVIVNRHTVRLTDRAAGEPEASWDAPKRKQKARQFEDKAVFLAYRERGDMARLIKEHAL